MTRERSCSPLISTQRMRSPIRDSAQTNPSALVVPIKRALLLAMVLPLLAHSTEPDVSVRAVEVLRTTQTWAHSPIEFPRGQSEVIGLAIEIAPGGETGWHSHPVPSFGYVVAGTIELTLPSGAVKRFRAGEAFAEVIDVSHNGRNVGPDRVKLIVFYASTRGQPISKQTRD
jgi:quercetin dioxygenase-like cupin family protein